MHQIHKNPYRITPTTALLAAFMLSASALLSAPSSDASSSSLPPTTPVPSGISHTGATSTITDAPVVAIGSRGLSVTSANQQYRMRLRGNIHADARFYISEGPTGDTFLMRRIRPILDGTVAGKFDYRIMPDFSGSSFTLLDANATYRHSPALNVMVGKAKTPFDLERLVSQTDLLFVERAYPTILGPNRDIGVQVFGSIHQGKLSYQLAVVNGVSDNASSVSDSNDGKDIYLRLFSHPFKDSGHALAGLGLGFAAGFGERDGAPAAYRTLAQQPFVSWNQGVVFDGQNTRLSPQLYFYQKSFGFMASFVSSTHELLHASEHRKVTHNAWQVSARWALTGETVGHSGLTPEKDFNLREGNWGAWELAARASQLSIDADVFPTFANPEIAARKVFSCTLGMNGYLNRNVKLVFNYEHSNFTGGAAGPVSARSEHAILARTQISF